MAMEQFEAAVDSYSMALELDSSIGLFRFQTVGGRRRNEERNFRSATLAWPRDSDPVEVVFNQSLMVSSGNVQIAQAKPEKNESCLDGLHHVESRFRIRENKVFRHTQRTRPPTELTEPVHRTGPH